MNAFLNMVDWLHEPVSIRTYCHIWSTIFNVSFLPSFKLLRVDTGCVQYAELSDATLWKKQKGHDNDANSKSVSYRVGQKHRQQSRAGISFNGTISMGFDAKCHVFKSQPSIGFTLNSSLHPGQVTVSIQIRILDSFWHISWHIVTGPNRQDHWWWWFDLPVCLLNTSRMNMCLLTCFFFFTSGPPKAMCRCNVMFTKLYLLSEGRSRCIWDELQSWVKMTNSPLLPCVTSTRSSKWTLFLSGQTYG